LKHPVYYYYKKVCARVCALNSHAVTNRNANRPQKFFTFIITDRYDLSSIGDRKISNIIIIVIIIIVIIIIHQSRVNGFFFCVPTVRYPRSFSRWRFIRSNGVARHHRGFDSVGRVESVRQTKYK